MRLLQSQAPPKTAKNITFFFLWTLIGSIFWNKNISCHATFKLKIEKKNWMGCTFVTDSSSSNFALLSKFDRLISVEGENGLKILEVEYYLIDAWVSHITLCRKSLDTLGLLSRFKSETYCLLNYCLIKLFFFTPFSFQYNRVFTPDLQKVPKLLQIGIFGMRNFRKKCVNFYHD